MKNLFHYRWLHYLLLISSFSCTNRISYSFQERQEKFPNEVQVENAAELIASLDPNVSPEIIEFKQQRGLPMPAERKADVRKVRIEPELPAKSTPDIYKKIKEDLKRREPLDKDTVFQFIRILALLYLIAALIVAIFVNFWLGLLMVPILIFFMPFISYLLYGEFNLIIIIFLILGDGKIGG